VRRLRAPGGGATITEAGSLKLADVVTSSTPTHSASGKSLASLPLQTDTIGGRLYAMSKLYSRWKFLSATLRYVPAVSSATDGSLVVFYSQDPDETYEIGETVGSNNAASAIDNMEFSVREKMNMTLHLPTTVLYCTPNGGAEKSWHVAGVVNVVSNGALVASKTYGSLYLDFRVVFSQPCAPFDPNSPIPSYYVASLFTGAGASGPGAPASPLFNWQLDAPKLDASYGPNWLIDPTTGHINTQGRLYVPPMSAVSICLILNDTAAVAGDLIMITSSTQFITFFGGASMFGHSADWGAKWIRGVVSNSGSVPGWFCPTSNVGAPGTGIVSAGGSVTCSIVPFVA